MKPTIERLAQDGYGVDDIRALTGHSYHIIEGTLKRLARMDRLYAPLARIASRRVADGEARIARKLTATEALCQP